MNEDNPGRMNGKALFREMYRVHPYGRPVIGYDNTIRETTRDDLLAYFTRYYYPGNMGLVIANPFPPLPTHESPSVAAPAEPPQKETRVRVQERDAKRAYLDIGFHGPSMRDEDVFAWDLLSMILGSGAGSRLLRV